MRLWLILAMFLVSIPLHYTEQLLGEEAPSSLLGLERHTIERLFLLLPVTYTGVSFGIGGGLIALAVALAIMLPRAIFISSAPADALLETGGVIVTGGFINLWLDSRQRERRVLMEMLARLRAAQEELQSKLQVIEVNERQLAAVNDISNIVSQSLELRDILNLAAGKVREVANVDAVLISLVDEGVHELVLEAYEGISELTAASVKRMKFGEGLDGQVAKTGEPLVVEDASHDPRLTKPMIAQEKIQAQLIVPLESKGKVLGTLCVASRQPRRFGREETDLLCAGGKVIGIAVENARLYGRERQVAARLQQSEESYRGLFENATEAIFIHDLQGEIIAANRACTELTGYSREDLVEMNVKDFLSKEGLEQAREVRRKLLRGEALSRPYEQRLTKEDGSEVRLRLSATLITKHGHPRAFQVIARDITGEGLTEENS